MPKIDIASIPIRVGSAFYPSPFRERAAGRAKQPLCNAAGLTQFGVNLTRLPPGNWSSERHWHTEEDEFIYVLAGEIVLIEEGGETLLRAGDCAAFPKNSGNGHHLINRGTQDALYLEVGSRIATDAAHFSDVDLDLPSKAVGFTRKNGTPYPKR